MITSSHRYRRFTREQLLVLNHIFTHRLRSAPGVVYGFQLDRNEALVSEPGLAADVGVDRYVARRVLRAGVEEGWWTRRPATRTYLLRDAHSSASETHIAGPRDAHSHSNRPSIIKVLCLKENPSPGSPGPEPDPHIDPPRDAHSERSETHMNQTSNYSDASTEEAKTKTGPRASLRYALGPELLSLKLSLEQKLDRGLAFPSVESFDKVAFDYLSNLVANYGVEAVAVKAAEIADERVFALAWFASAANQIKARLIRTYGHGNGVSQPEDDDDDVPEEHDKWGSGKCVDCHANKVLPHKFVRVRRQ